MGLHHPREMASHDPVFRSFPCETCGGEITFLFDDDGYAKAVDHTRPTCARWVVSMPVAQPKRLGTVRA